VSQKIPTVEVVRGKPIQIPVLLVDCNGVKFPTCGLTGVTLFVQKEDDTYFEKAAATGLTLGYGDSTSLYIFNFDIAETELFKLVMVKNVFLKITFANTSLKFLIKDFLTVKDEL
jgi:hypothetical protein